MRRSSLLGVALGAMLAALPVASLALTVYLDLESVTVDATAHELVLVGTVTCDAGATVQIGFALTQGPAEVLGSETLTCTGTEQEWEIREALGTPPVHPGPGSMGFGFTAQLGDESIAFGRELTVFVAPAEAAWLFTMQEPE